MARARAGIGVRVTSENAANRPLGLPDEAFAQKRPVRGLITKSEVRAVSLYKLGLRRNSVVWDVGAGSGSVALEAALIASEGTVYAVERDGECVEMLRHNIANLGPSNIVVEAGEAPDALDGLPAPDCVFVGGGGSKLADILECAVSRLSAGGRIVVNLAAIERVQTARACLVALGFDVETTMISASRGSALPDGTTRLAAQNPVFIVTGIDTDGQGKQAG
ncbi:MAG: precorrin-6Y C5,15-methyltransferase (decarboxylating) subunit CbiT [Chloroflexota bacterium]|nr:precorrin-6Y C5,15-methyltransferase (decarboxylating) subunit CbiT [Chloroflexota bacterium]